VDRRRRWHFGACLLDERTCELLVDGIDAELERKPLEVLIYLLQHAGEVCTKDELLSNVWPGRVLSESVLTKCVGRLREVLQDDNQEIIKTAYGFGYRIATPVRVEVASAPQLTQFDLKSGDHPPGRPLWSLIERLGAGGHGEAWRARHDKTNEQRVFKFALNGNSLVALKREITLFRLMNETLGDRAPVVKLLDWNLEQDPYFLETEYIAGGSLLDWAESKGGLAGVPIDARIQIVANIAEALSTVHSVGVLHKDLKPSNILMRPRSADVMDVVLADFGSGGVLDFERIEQLGITRLGFTKTVAVPDHNTGTPMYLAPEVLAGFAFTVKSDIYALGVILYQILIGDFHKVMSTGWERNIEDELLREDVALLSDGNVAERLGDAETIARRLRSLSERRKQLEMLRESQIRADRARRLLEKAKARRFGLLLAFAAMCTGTAVSTALYFKARQAQKQAEIAAAQSKAVTDFLSKDVFAPVSSGSEPVKNMSAMELLRRAGGEIDAHFLEQPQIAAELHYIIGQSFNGFYEYPLSVRHFRRAMELGERLNGAGAESVLRSAAQLIEIDFALGNLPLTISRYEAILKTGEDQVSRNNPALFELRQRLARGHYRLGDWVQAAQSLRDVLQRAHDVGYETPEFVGRTEFYLGQVLTDLAQPKEAQLHLRQALTRLTASLGEAHVQVAEAKAALGRALADAGLYSEAATEIDNAEKLAIQWAPPDTWPVVRPRFFRGLLFLHQDEPNRAETLLAEIVELQDAHMAAYLQAHAGSEPDLDHTAPVREALGEAYARQGKLTEAIPTLQKAIAVGERADGALHPLTTSARLLLAECYLLNGDEAQARAILASATIKLTALPPLHPIAAQWQHVTGLLAQRDGSLSEAREALEHSRQIYQTLYGPKHWRVLRVTLELKRLAQRSQP
jgi:non-specific serine/threonine protein kinase